MTTYKNSLKFAKLKRICAVYGIFWNEPKQTFRCELCPTNFSDLSVEMARKHWELKHKENHFGS